jgi:hypothetical protein
MAEVHEAHDDLLDRRVAVKVFRAAEAAHRDRFDAEVRLLASLNHPGLVAVYDAGEHAGDGYMVLELVEGPTLRDVLADRAPLPAHEVAALGATLADALAHVHERGIVHRDLTPANVLCGADGTPRLTDFGIARLLDTTRVTAEHLTVGTVGYMAPEQVEGKDVTPAADVYALGLVLLEALTATPAFTGPSHEVAVARLTRDPAVPSHLPSPWPDLLRSMTARRPEDRPGAAEVAARLWGARPGAASSAAGLLLGHDGPEGQAWRSPAVVIPSSGAVTDPHAETASLPVAETGEAPAAPAAPVTSVMPAAMLPVEEIAPQERVDPSPTPATVETGPRAEQAPLVAALAAGATGVQDAVGTAAHGVRERARRMSFHQWLAVAAAAVFVLAVWQSGQGDWAAQVRAAQAAAEAQAPAPTTTTVAPTTTTTAAPVAPAPAVEEDDDREGGRGKGKDKDDD